jgi:hypothetical protein
MGADFQYHCADIEFPALLICAFFAVMGQMSLQE